ncbi:hypothetical protein ABPG72_002952 [Tetrahymena utriculariae]
MKTSKYQLDIELYPSISKKNFEESEFIQNLDPNLKIVTLIGPPGEGKTWILNNIIFILEEQKTGHHAQYTSQSRSRQYPGMKLYICQHYLFAEFENLDYSQDNQINQDMRDLMLYFTKISMCVIYVHHSIRLTKGFEDMAQKIQQQFRKEQSVFIEILNKWNGDRIQSYKDLENYEGLFQVTFQLKSLNFRNSQVVQDNNLKQFLSQVNYLVSYIFGLKFNNESTSEAVFQGISNFNTKITQDLNLSCVINTEQNQLEEFNSENEYDVNGPLLGNKNVQPNQNKIWGLLNIIFLLIIYFLPNISQDGDINE